MLATKKDLGAILRLQKTAFEAVAAEYGDWDMPPMTQTQDQIESDYRDGYVFFKATDGQKIVGSIRGVLGQDEVCKIAKLVVLPEYQKNGIGLTLIHEIEAYFSACKEYQIFTGDKSTHVIRMYEQLGYKAFKNERHSDYNIVHMRKLSKGSVPKL
ncbi:MAG: GNAT family N-acetyltransferase [Actinobacteria bacterium]|nr:GNAT family N-acetyltransferase [Actinomycetota bacterium]